MAWFAYRESQSGPQPQVLYMEPRDGAGAVNWNGFVQKHRIEDEEATLGIKHLKKMYPLKEG